ncbi:MAG: type II 3-dehydroquinate dehydratase, partial [Pseudomonadota bacterium]
MKLLFINGPNLNLLGKREPDKYGSMTLQKINEMIESCARKENVEAVFFQSNAESALIDEIHTAMGTYDGIVINPGAYTHSSIALRDAIIASGIPTVEVHLSNIYSREEFRKKSFISDVAVGV